MTRTAAFAGALVLAMASAAFAQDAAQRQGRRQRGPEAKPADTSRLTNEQLLSEIRSLKARIAKLEASQTARVKAAPKTDRTARMSDRGAKDGTNGRKMAAREHGAKDVRGMMAQGRFGQGREMAQARFDKGRGQMAQGRFGKGRHQMANGRFGQGRHQMAKGRFGHGRHQMAKGRFGHGRHQMAEGRFGQGREQMFRGRSSGSRGQMMHRFGRRDGDRR
ncbi:MAG: hypothetical protein LLG01_00175 [Planctomycetaceae bacterium]|nr:hypothetical protein [Planctomycetaceae bacterium]